MSDAILIGWDHVPGHDMAHATACRGVWNGMARHMLWHTMGYAKACHGIWHGMAWHGNLPGHAMASARVAYAHMPWPDMAYASTRNGICYGTPWHVFAVRLLAPWIHSKALNSTSGTADGHKHFWQTEDEATYGEGTKI